MTLLPHLRRIFPAPIVTVIWVAYCGLGSLWLGPFRRLVYILGGVVSGLGFLLAALAYLTNSGKVALFLAFGWQALLAAVVVGVLGDLLFSDAWLREAKARRIAQRL